MTLTLLHNGRIHTSADPDATAIAIADNTISWIGAQHAIPVAGDPDRVVDLKGALVIPGFVDAHVHSTEAGLALSGLDLTGCGSLAECLARVGAFALAKPAGVLWGHGWEDTRWPERRPPTRAEVDRAVGGRPAYLSRIDVHSAQVSSALAAGVRDGAALVGWSDTDPVTQQAHAAVRAVAREYLSQPQRTEAQVAFLTAAAARGIVEVHECAVDDRTGRADLAALLALDAPVGVRGYLAARITDPEQARTLMAETGAHALGGDLVIDGAIGSRTAALRHDYQDQPGNRGRDISPTSRSPTTWWPARWLGCRPASMRSGTMPFGRSPAPWRKPVGAWAITRPCGWPAAGTGSNTPRCPTTTTSRPSRETA